MSDNGLRERVARLEAQMAAVQNDITRLNDRVDLFINNELKHVDDRLGKVEKRGKLGPREWATIITALIAGACGVIIALVNLLGK